MDGQKNGTWESKDVYTLIKWYICRLALWKFEGMETVSELINKHK
jgi:hypothetical protein